MLNVIPKVLKFEKTSRGKVLCDDWWSKIFITWNCFLWVTFSLVKKTHKLIFVTVFCCLNMFYRKKSFQLMCYCIWISSRFQCAKTAKTIYQNNKKCSLSALLNFFFQYIFLTLVSHSWKFFPDCEGLFILRVRCFWARLNSSSSDFLFVYEKKMVSCILCETNK